MSAHIKTPCLLLPPPPMSPPLSPPSSSPLLHPPQYQPPIFPSSVSTATAIASAFFLTPSLVHLLHHHWSGSVGSAPSPAL